MKPVSSGSVGSVNLNPPGNAAGGEGKVAQQAAGQLAGNVAGTIAHALNLGVDPDGRQRQLPTGQDAYDVEAAADALAERLGASPSERGELARTLHAFVAEVAASIGAVPDSRALTQIASVISAMEDSRDAASAIRSIIQATDRLASRR